MKNYRLRDRAQEWFPYDETTIFLPIFIRNGEWWCSKCRHSSRDFKTLMIHERRHGSIALLQSIARTTVPSSRWS